MRPQEGEEPRSACRWHLPAENPAGPGEIIKAQGPPGLSSPGRAQAGPGAGLATQLACLGVERRTP